MLFFILFFVEIEPGKVRGLWDSDPLSSLWNCRDVGPVWLGHFESKSSFHNTKHTFD